MGLRIQPKVKPFDPKLYQQILSNLLQGQAASTTSHIFWDLDEGEDASKARKDLMYVSEQEGIGLTVSGCLSLLESTW